MDGVGEYEHLLMDTEPEVATDLVGDAENNKVSCTGLSHLRLKQHICMPKAYSCPLMLGISLM